MRSSAWLRISSVVAFLTFAGHLSGARKAWSPMGENEVLQAMRTVRFETVGVSRTYLDFYMGFGYSLAVSNLLVAVLLWQLAGLAKAGTVSVRPQVAALLAATLATAFLAWRFIFLVPALFFLALGVCLLLALVSKP